MVNTPTGSGLQNFGLQETKAGEGWIITFTGKHIQLMKPYDNEYDIVDIAHGLSNTCRWAGQTIWFVSVAQHSCVVADLLWDDRELAYQGLMHDSAEAYLGDVTNPLKALLPYYKILETGFDKAISLEHGFAYPMNGMVKLADRVSMAQECRDVVAPYDPTHLKLPDPPEEILKPWAAQYAEEQFLIRYHALTNSGINHDGRKITAQPMGRW